MDTDLASSAGISPDESGGGKKFGEMPAINRHKNLHCVYRLAHANFDKHKLRGSRKGLQQGVEKFLFSTRWLIKLRRITVKLMNNPAL
jgi:hypothetical protein